MDGTGGVRIYGLGVELEPSRSFTPQRPGIPLTMPRPLSKGNTGRSERLRSSGMTSSTGSNSSNSNGAGGALMEHYVDKINVYPDVHHLLDRLRGSFRMILTSNAGREFIDVEMGATGLDRYFDRIFSATSDFREVKRLPVSIGASVKCSTSLPRIWSM